MISRIKQLPPVYGWAAVAVSAAFAAYYSSGSYVAITAFAAVCAYGSGLWHSGRRLLARRATEHERELHRTDLAIGRYAPYVMLGICTADGTMFYRTLAELLVDDTPEGLQMVWDEPTAVVLLYRDPPEMP